MTNPEFPHLGTVKITVEGPGNTGKTAVALLISEMLQKLGHYPRSMKFSAPAPKIIGMDTDTAENIVRGLVGHIKIDVEAKTVPRDRAEAQPDDSTKGTSAD